MNPSYRDMIGRFVAASGLLLCAAPLAGSPCVRDEPCTEHQKLPGVEMPAESRIGYSVAVCGDIALYGSPECDDPGCVFATWRVGDSWEDQLYPVAPDDIEAGGFGYCIAMDGMTAVIGAPRSDHNEITNVGAAYIFTHQQEGQWGKIATLLASDGLVGDSLGRTAALDGDTALVSKRCYEATGAVYVFQQNHGGPDNWGQVAKLTASDGGGNDYFGAGLAISGDFAAIGAYHVDPLRGAVYIFHRDHGGPDQWGEVLKIPNPGDPGIEAFGLSVALDGDTMLVAARDWNIGPCVGVVYVFEHGEGRPGDWTLVAEIPSPYEEPFAECFGVDLAVEGDRAVIGAPAGFDGGPGPGTVHVFERDFGGTDNWGEVFRMRNDDPAHGDHFGQALDVSGDFAFVGAPDWGDWDLQGSAYMFSLSACRPCFADFDGDGDVDTADLLHLLGAWGTPGGDVDGDGDTDTADLLALLAAWGECP